MISLAPVGQTLSGLPLAAQQPAADPFIVMADTERAFAARAAVVGWKQSFLEFFADEATGFDGGPGPAKEQIRKNPDPPANFQLLWEPRVGDIAASGDLGWLTGPSTSINPARTPSTRYGVYASVWKRQADGTFKVVLDVGVNTPNPADFAPGLTRANRADRFTGTDTTEEATRSLAMADAALNTSGAGEREGLLGRLAVDGRIHRTGWAPVIGRAAADAWLMVNPENRQYISGFVEVAAAHDMGFTWGSYSAGADSGHYARVWNRARDGSWRLALDVLQ